MFKRHLSLAPLAMLIFGLAAFAEQISEPSFYEDLGGGIVALTMFAAAVAGFQLVRLRRK